MSGIQLSGLASGLDWKTLVDQLIAAEQTPVNTLQAEKSAGAKKITTLGTLSEDLTALQTSIKALSGDGMFAGRSAKIADSTSTWSATASAGTTAGQYVFNVSKLATTAQRNGSTNAGAGISATDDVSGVTLATMNISTAITAGDFTVNGQKISIALTDSLQSVFQKIQDATGVTATYDHNSDTVSLSSSGPIVIGSASDSSNFLTALKLYNQATPSTTIQSTSTLGVPNLNSTIENSNLKAAIGDVDASGNGTFSINGVAISFNTKTDSIQAVMNRINTSSAGVTASYDKASDKFILTNKVTGNLGLTVSEASNGFLEALGLNSTSTFASGSNAEFKVNNGSTLVSTSNNLGPDVTGISGLAVTATTTGSQTVNVTSDTTDARAKIDDFIAKYNAVQDYIDQQTKVTIGSDGKVTTSTLSSNHDVSDMAHSLRGLAFGAIPGLTGTIKRLADIGIDFKTGTSDLQVSDSAKLNDALANHSDAVSSLFGEPSNGLIHKIDSYVTKVTGTGGLISHLTDSINHRGKEIDDQIARLNAQIAEDRTRLTNSFIAMEQAQSNIQSQAAAFNNAFGHKNDNNQ